jgi:hypothetical protein
MAITNAALEITQARGPSGPAGQVSTAALNAAIAALKGTAPAQGDTLGELYNLILACAPLDGANLTNATATTQSLGNNSNKISTTAFVAATVANAIATLVNSAPALLDTLGELSDALGDDPNFAATVTNLIATKQPLDASLTAFAALTTAANKGIYFTAADTPATYDLSSYARTLLDDASASAAQATLGLVIGTNVQAFDATLAAFAGITTAANKLIYATGADAFATTDFSAYGRTLVDDADAPTARATLGLPTTTANRLWGNDGSGNPSLITMPAAGLTLSAGAISFANDHAALEALSGTGIARRTATDTWSVGTTVAVNEGGTGQVSLTANGVLLGNGTGGINVTAAGAAKSVLQGVAAADPVFTATPTLAGLTINANAAALPAAAAAGTLLQIGNADAANTRLEMLAFGTGAFPTLQFRAARGTAGAPSAHQSGDVLAQVSSQGYGASQYVFGPSMYWITTQNWTNAAAGAYFLVQVTPNGSTAATNAFKIDQDSIMQFPTATSIAANGSVATALTSVGPAGANTTVQEWLKVKNAAGTVRYVPMF